MKFEFKPIGFVRHNRSSVPRHWLFSDLVGELVLEKDYIPGLKNIEPGERIQVIFCFHKSSAFRSSKLVQTSPHRGVPLGVFSICSPFRPNPIGLSVLQVLKVEENVLKVQGLDMLDQTPILDIKPYVMEERDCPSAKD